MAEDAEMKEDDYVDDMCIGGNADFEAGQKYATPAPANGDRVFYETLLEQRPDSEMAQDWCLAYGILPADKAEKLYKTVCNRKGIKPSPAAKKSSSSSSSSSSNQNNHGRAKKAKVVVEGDMVMDSGFANSAVWEGQGTSGI